MKNKTTNQKYKQKSAVTKKNVAPQLASQLSAHLNFNCSIQQVQNKGKQINQQIQGINNKMGVNNRQQEPQVQITKVKNNTRRQKQRSSHMQFINFSIMSAISGQNCIKIEEQQKQMDRGIIQGNQLSVNKVGQSILLKKEQNQQQNPGFKYFDMKKIMPSKRKKRNKSNQVQIINISSDESNCNFQFNQIQAKIKLQQQAFHKKQKTEFKFKKYIPKQIQTLVKQQHICEQHNQNGEKKVHQKIENNINTTQKGLNQLKEQKISKKQRVKQKKKQKQRQKIVKVQKQIEYQNITTPLKKVPVSFIVEPMKMEQNSYAKVKTYFQQICNQVETQVFKHYKQLTLFTVKTLTKQDGKNQYRHKLQQSIKKQFRSAFDESLRMAITDTTTKCNVSLAQIVYALGKQVQS